MNLRVSRHVELRGKNTNYFVIYRNFLKIAAARAIVNSDHTGHVIQIV